MLCPKCNGSLHHLRDREMLFDNRFPGRSHKYACTACLSYHTTYETFQDPTVFFARHRVRVEQANRAKKSRGPDYERDYHRRQNRRIEARKEAALTGEPVQQIYERWGVA